mmetsp:Transcript_55038/g.112472  ORF Transcript_55038/g.112472 Transcript_55038/m.112472 type:complete len:208 (-) Transcript_55038:256-879(-)
MPRPRRGVQGARRRRHGWLRHRHEHPGRQGRARCGLRLPRRAGARARGRDMVCGAQRRHRAGVLHPDGALHSAHAWRANPEALPGRARWARVRESRYFRAAHAPGEPHERRRPFKRRAHAQVGRSVGRVGGTALRRGGNCQGGLGCRAQARCCADDGGEQGQVEDEARPRRGWKQERKEARREEDLAGGLVEGEEKKAEERMMRRCA